MVGSQENKQSREEEMLDEFGFDADALLDLDPDAAATAATASAAAVHRFSEAIAQVPSFLGLLSPRDRCHLWLANKRLGTAIADQIEPLWSSHQLKLRRRWEEMAASGRRTPATPHENPF